MSGFNRQYGYLFMFGNDVQDSINLMHVISEKTYKAAKKPIDLDPYRDANGNLHRNVLQNIPIQVEFQTIPGLTDTQIENTWGAIIRNSFTIGKERKIHATFWLPEDNDYVTQDLYVADPEFTIRQVQKDSSGNYQVIYEPITFKFTGY